MRPIGHPDFQYTPWSPERRAAASKAARARAKAGQPSPRGNLRSALKEADVNGELRPKAEELRSPKRGQFAFQSDILMEKAEPAIPLVVVELKFGGFSTHDIIMYSSKATRHKEIYPDLRYGFVVGGSDALRYSAGRARGGCGRFILSGLGAITGQATDRKRLIDLVKRQIDNAETLVEMMRTNRTTFTRYEKNIHVER
jgi:hypothetical protein